MADQRELNIRLTVSDQLSGKLKEVGQNTKDLEKKTSGLTVGVKSLVGAYIGVQGLRMALRHTIGAAIDWESAFTGVRKTVDGTEEDLAGLSKELRRMSLEIPISAIELAGLAEVAGQLGVGIDDISEFTEVIAKLGITTNLSAEDAAIAIARFSNTMGIAIDDLDRIGSVIVELGNNFATTESEITEFSKRIGVSANQVGLTAPEVLGLSAALSSLGINAEAGGTAVQKVLLEIDKSVITSGSNLEVLAKVSGLSAEEFSRQWRENAGETFLAFVEGLGKQGNKAQLTLGELGLSNERVRLAFLALSSGSDDLALAMQTANQEFEENNALNDEAAKRFSTSESELALLLNKFIALGRFIGTVLLPVVNLAARGFNVMGEIVMWFADGISDAYNKVNRISGAVDAFSGQIDGLQTLLPVATSSVDLLADGLGGMTDEAIEAAKKVAGLREELTGMVEDSAKNEASTNQNLAEAIISQEEKVAGIKKEIRQLERDDEDGQNARKIDALRNTLSIERDALRGASDMRKTLSVELEEAERRASLTIFERKVEDILKQRVLYLQNHLARLQEISLEIGVEQAKDTAISESYSTAQAQMREETVNTTQVVIDEALKQVDAWNDVARAISKATGGKSGGQSKYYGGERELGGPVSAGKSYLVGEKGPELFSPSSSGNITPNNKLGGGGISITINGDVTGEDAMERLGEVIMQKVNQRIRLS